MSQSEETSKSGRTFWVLLAALLLLWQVGQALVAEKFGIPGVFEIPIEGLAGHFEGGGPGAVSIARKSPEGGEEPVISEPQDQPLAPAASPPPPSPMAPSSEMEGWIRTQAREFVGGMDEAGNMLYRFDVWLDIPGETKSRIMTVDYAFDAPSAKPSKRTSKDGKSGFRVSFGGLTCATSIAFTVTYQDGQSQSATVDGCEVLN